MSEEMATYTDEKTPPVIYAESSSLFASTFLLPSEDPIHFHQLREQLSVDMGAEGVMEHSLVEIIAATLYRIKRLDQEEMIAQLAVTPGKETRAAKARADTRLQRSEVRERMDKELADARQRDDSLSYWILRDTCPTIWTTLCAYIDADPTWLDCMTEGECQVMRLRKPAKRSARIPVEHKKLNEIMDWVDLDKKGLPLLLVEMMEKHPFGYTREDAEQDSLVGSHRIISRNETGLANHSHSHRAKLQHRRTELNVQLAQTTKELRNTQNQRIKRDKIAEKEAARRRHAASAAYVY